MPLWQLGEHGGDDFGDAGRALAVHEQHRLAALVGYLLPRERGTGGGNVLQEESVVVDAAEDDTVSVEYVFAHHLPVGDARHVPKHAVPRKGLPTASTAQSNDLSEEGTVASALRRDSVFHNLRRVPRRSGFGVSSARGGVHGHVEFVEDHEAALEFCRKLCRRFPMDEAAIEEEIQLAGAAVLVFALVPEHVTGKRVHEA